MISIVSPLYRCETLIHSQEVPYGTDPNYKDALLNMEKFRSNSQFCDMTLIVQGVEFPVHKVVLASFSLYFEKLFSSDFPEKDKKSIELHDFEAASFRLILDYMYSGHIDISLDNVAEALKEADFLQLDWLKSHCCDFILRNINVDNCIAFWKVGALFMAQTVEMRSYAYANSKLDAVSQTPDFLALGINEVIQLIQTDKPTILHNQDCFLAVTRWVQQNIDERENDLEKLLSLLRPQLFSKLFLETYVFNHTLLRENITGANWLLDNFCFKQSQEAKPPAISSSVQLNERDKHLFITDVRKGIYTYNTVNKEVTRFCERPDFRGSALAPYQGCIYVLGGKRTKTGLKYNVAENSWSQFPFQCYLSCASVCVVNDAAYLAGGSMPTYWFNKVYKVNFADLKTENQPRMLMRRSDHGSVSYDNCIYVCGGTSGGGATVLELNLSERMDVREGMWRLLPTMQDNHAACSVARVNESIYCSNTLGSLTERFDIRRSRWERIANAPGSYGSICSYNNKLYRIHNAGIAVYSEGSDSWQQDTFYGFEFPSATSLWKLFD